MDELSKLGLKYGTDKIGKHHYLPVYFELFKDRRDQVKNVLEIGVAEGAGIKMFREFFPNAKIFGLDNQDNRIFAGDRLEVLKADQSKMADLSRAFNYMGHKFDLIIDDGSHKPEDQVFTCLEIMYKVDPGVIYIIEDVSDPKIVEKLGKYNCEVRKVGSRYDDCLIIVRK